MTQHLDRPAAAMIDPSVDAETTTPAGGTPRVQNPGWPPPGGTVPTQYGPVAAPPASGPYAAPAGTVPGAVAPVPAEAPLNTLSWVSVVLAFVVSPVAIVLGAISRRQIARTGERGKGLATTGIALGIVFTLMGIVSTIMVLSMVTTVTYTPAPAPAPAASAPSSAAGAPASADPGTSTGQADLLSGYLDLVAANQQLSKDFEAHDTAAAFRTDISTYRDAVATFRSTVAAANLPADQRARVDSQLLPAIDKVLADCDAMLKTSSQSTLEKAAGDFDTDNPAMMQTASTALAG